MITKHKFLKIFKEIYLENYLPSRKKGELDIFIQGQLDVLERFAKKMHIDYKRKEIEWEEERSKK